MPKVVELPDDVLAFMRANNLWIDSLAARWEDEQGLEDWGDYRTVISRKVEEYGFKFVSAFGTPFCFTFEDKKGVQWEVQVEEVIIRCRQV